MRSPVEVLHWRPIFTPQAGLILHSKKKKIKIKIAAESGVGDWGKPKGEKREVWGFFSFFSFFFWPEPAFRK